MGEAAVDANHARSRARKPPWGRHVNEATPYGPSLDRPRLAFDDAFTLLFRQSGGVLTLAAGGALLLLFGLIVPALVVMGYGVELGRKVAVGEESLPRFRLVQAVDGLKLSIVMLVYSVPVFVLYFVAILPALLVSLGREEFATPYFTFRFFALIGLLVFYGLVMAFLQPAIFATYIRFGTVGSCFSVSKLGAVVRHWRGAYVAAAAIIFAMSQLAGIGVLLLFVGLAFTVFFHFVFMFHLSGQLARPLLGRAQGGG